MAKVLLINGSPNQHGCTDVALSETAEVLKKEGMEVEMMWLGKKPMQDCIVCGYCMKHGCCMFKDQVNEAAEKLKECDGLIVGSPVYYGSANGRITSFLDRLFFSAGRQFAGKFAAAVVSCRRGGATVAFQRLNMYFLMSNMHVVGSQYWNQIHGFTADEARQDAEGLQTMRTLGQNMAYLIKAKETADKAGIEKPVYEEWQRTDFIR